MFKVATVGQLTAAILNRRLNSRFAGIFLQCEQHEGGRTGNRFRHSAQNHAIAVVSPALVEGPVQQ